MTFSTEIIEAEHLFPTAWRQPIEVAIAPIGPGLVPPPAPLPSPALASLAGYEAMVKDAMAEALQRHGSLRAAADSMGMAKSTFADRARRLGIPMPYRGRR